MSLAAATANRGMLLRRLKLLIGRKLGVNYRRSYAQCGEDVIARTVFDLLQIPKPNYLDIGAHDPRYLSNTYLFYREGSHGINVEPDPLLHARLTRARPRDLNLNVGVGAQPGTLDLHIMSTRTLNTFSAVEAQSYERQGYRIVGKQPVRVVTINQLIDEHPGHAPDFLSVDVEGLDYEILASLDVQLHRPALICVETIQFATTGEGVKRPEIDELLTGRGYLRFADTYINSLYVDRTRWVDR